MPVSRLRLQLAGWFALAFLVGLGAADGALFAFLRGRANAAFGDALGRAAGEFAQAVRREMADTPGGLGAVAREAFSEWPPDSNGFAVVDSTGARVFVHGEPDAATTRSIEAASPGPRPFRVVAFRSTAGLEAANRALGWWLVSSVPIIVVLALVFGYFLARRALRPLSAMSAAITGIAPDELDRRLPVRAPADELDLLADRFNQLMARLAETRARNRRFLAQVAHQLKTPLTVIRGESELGLGKARSAEEHQQVLRRVAMAAQQMAHRVDDLVLLAQAEAGEKPPLTERVDLDGTVLECVDLMRGRAAALGRRFELGEIEAVEVTGSETLLREAVTELLENACRHGSGAVVQVAAGPRGTVATIAISGEGPVVPAESLADDARARPDRSGLGLSIVRWIAGLHGGRLAYRRDGGRNVFVLELPWMTKPVTPPSSAAAILEGQST